MSISILRNMMQQEIEIEKALYSSSIPLVREADLLGAGLGGGFNNTKELRPAKYNRRQCIFRRSTNYLHKLRAKTGGFVRCRIIVICSSGCGAMHVTYYVFYRSFRFDR